MSFDVNQNNQPEGNETRGAAQFAAADAKSALTETKQASIVSTTVLENLAARFRPGGMFLVLMRPDGTIVWSDPLAGLFFQRYVLPLLQYDEPDSDFGIREKIEKLATGAAVIVWDALPGIIAAAFPCAQKRQTTGVLMLAAKSPAFKLGEDVVRVCGRLGLDGIWLGQQADELPTHNEEIAQRQARLLLNMMRDQVRLDGLQNELDSLSGQLANTYEELSLIYQISSGMRINRRANDFFKQACLDVLEVMGVQGMGVALDSDQEGTTGPVLYGPMSLPPGTIHRLSNELIPILRERKAAFLVNDLAGDKNL